MTSRSKAPMGYRLASRAFKIADRIRRDQGDDSLADLLESLASELQREMKGTRTGLDAIQRDFKEVDAALANHGYNIAVNALFEIRDMSLKDSLIRGKCRRVLKILKLDPDAPLRRKKD